MPFQAAVTLSTLRCIQESDEAGTSHSEPYIWPFLASFSTAPLGLETTPTFANQSESRKIIKNEMRAGDSAALEFPGNQLTIHLPDSQASRELILVVALWEADDTPIMAVQAGYQAFLDELSAQLGANALQLSQADENQQNAIIEGIKSAVHDKVYTAIKNKLSGVEVAEAATGFLNLDDPMATAFKHFPNLATTSFTLGFKGVSGDPRIILTGGHGQAKAIDLPVDYEIDGDLKIVPVFADRCQSEVDALNSANAALQAVTDDVQSLQLQLQNAGPGQKAGIADEIKSLTNERLPPAQAAVAAAQQALAACRARGHVFDPSPPLSPALS